MMEKLIINQEQSQEEQIIFDPSSPQASIEEIIIHPGSKYLRIGRVSDSSPYKILHAIAKRRKKNDNDSLFIQRDNLISSLSPNNKLPPEFESARLQLCHTLQTTPKSDGGRRFITPTKEISEKNKSVKPEEVSSSSQQSSNTSFKYDSDEINTFYGDDVLEASTRNEFNIHFPWKRSAFNIHKGIGGSHTAVLSYMEEIWSWAICELLKIPKNNFENCRAVIIVPVMFNQSHCADLMSLLLTKMNFSDAFIMHDHVCASFSAGISIVTVVDVGDQHISVSCVDEGISLPETRVELKYGGGDLTVALWSLMTQSCVPLEVNINSLWDLYFLSLLKESYCHFDLDRCGPEKQTILYKKANERKLSYDILFGDELLIVPLSYFNPDLLRGSVEPRNSIAIFKTDEVSDDPFHNSFLIQTLKRSNRDFSEDECSEDNMDLINTSEKNAQVFSEPSRKIDLNQLIGIDQAIQHSIESNSTDEFKKKFYSCVLVVGGGFKFKGLGKWLQTKISQMTPRIHRSEIQEVIVFPKGKDPETLAWSGGALLTKLDSCSELWISKKDWNSVGSRLLREKGLCAF